MKTTEKNGHAIFYTLCTMCSKCKKSAKISKMALFATRIIKNSLKFYGFYKTSQKFLGHFSCQHLNFELFFSYVFCHQNVLDNTNGLLNLLEFKCNHFYSLIQRNHNLNFKIQMLVGKITKIFLRGFIKIIGL